MSVIINNIYRYQTVAVEGYSQLYVGVMKRQCETLKELIVKKGLCLNDFEFSKKGYWCKVCGKVYNSFHKEEIKQLIEETRKVMDQTNG